MSNFKQSDKQPGYRHGQQVFETTEFAKRKARSKRRRDLAKAARKKQR